MENVTEELVRQNGNQAAAVMADYVGQEGGGGGGGSTSGIPTIDKNTQPNLVWRRPTEEDLAKFPSSQSFSSVADLPEGKLPTLLVDRYFSDESNPDSEVVEVHLLASALLPVSDSGETGSASYAGYENDYVISPDGSLLAAGLIE